MTLLGITAVIAAAAWLVWSIKRCFRRRLYSSPWRLAVVVLGIAGMALGAWLVTRENLVSPTVRVVGYPFGVGGYELINGRWLGGLVSRFGLLPLIADIAAGIGICLLPLRVALFIFERRHPHASTPEELSVGGK